MYKSIFVSFLMIVSLIPVIESHARVQENKASKLVTRIMNDINNKCTPSLSILRTSDNLESKREKIVKIINIPSFFTRRPISVYIERTLNPQRRRLHELSRRLTRQGQLSDEIKTKINTLSNELKEIINLIKISKEYYKEPYFEFGLGKLINISVSHSDAQCKSIANLYHLN